MAWQDEAVAMLRPMLGDTSAAKYTDADLEQYCCLAARLVLQSTPFATAYAVSVADATLTPDPAAAGDDAFLNLMVLQAACMADRGAAALAAGQAIMVQDGASRIDLRSRFGAALDLLKHGWCAVYDRARADHLAGMRSGAVGGAVVGPVRRPGGSLPARGDLFG